MKKFVVICLIVIFVLLGLACLPTPTPQVPTATAEMPTMIIQPTGTEIPASPVPPTEDTPTPLPVATPTTESSITLQPSITPSKAPGETTVFTVTPIATKVPQGKDTPTPTKKVYFTYSVPTKASICSSDGNCGLLLDTDTILAEDLRVRFINKTSNQADLSVTMKLINTEFSTTMKTSVSPSRTGEVVFSVPCYTEATYIQLNIVFPGYTATQTMSYPQCFCERDNNG